MMALMAAAATTAFAQDDLVKQASRVDDYAQAVEMITPALTNAATVDKAKAWNTLADIAMRKYNKEDEARLTGSVTNAKFDQVGMVAAFTTALNAAVKCDEFDQLPNEKGKIKPRFHKGNVSRMKQPRVALINTGIDLINAQENETALAFYEAFVSSAKSPLFAEEKPSYVELASLYAGISAYNLKKYDVAKNYLTIALNDTAQEVKAQAQRYLLPSMASTLKTPQDTVNYINDLKGLLTANPDNTQFYGALGDILYQTNKIDELRALTAAHPTSELSYFYNGLIALDIDKKNDVAISEFSKIPSSSVFNPIATYNRARARYALVAEFAEQNSDARTGRMTPANEAKYKELVIAAKNEFEKVKELDPNQESFRWQYLLQNLTDVLGELNK